MFSSRPLIPVFIALLFHFCGVVGILFTPYKDWFIANTPLTLVLMGGLLYICQEKKQFAFVYFFWLCFVMGMITEMIGVNTGFLFGNYSYGEVLGFKIFGVPLLIGMNWFVVVYCSVILIESLNAWAKQRYAGLINPSFEKWSLIIDGALVATLFDWLMEPVAVKLGFWKWNTPEIPFLNYTCWFAISALLIALMQKMPFDRKNHFAVHLLCIQALFFLTLRLFL